MKSGEVSNNVVVADGGVHHVLNQEDINFIQVFQSLHALRDERAFPAWLTRITVHKATDWRKKRKKNGLTHHVDILTDQRNPHEAAEILGYYSFKIAQCKSATSKRVVKRKGRSSVNCEDIQELLSAYIDNELSSSGKTAIERHLSVCAECLQTVADLKHLSFLVETTLNDAVEPVDIEGRVMSGVKTSRQGTQVRRLSAVYIVGATVSAVVFIGLLLSPIGLLVRATFRLSFAMLDGLLDLLGSTAQGWMSVLVVFFIVLSGLSMLGVLRLLHTRYSEVLE